MSPTDPCTHTRAELGSYLDGELPYPSMKRVSDHLKECSVCQEELDALRALRTRLEALRSDPEADAARSRVFLRFRDQLSTEEQARTSALSGLWDRLLRPSFAFPLATAAALAVALSIPVGSQMGSQEAAPFLPDHSELSVLSQRHDLHVAQSDEAQAPTPVSAPGDAVDQPDGNGQAGR